MGIDIHTLQLLAHAQDLGVRFERTLAIGRQAVFVEDWELEAHRRDRALPPLDDVYRAKRTSYEPAASPCSVVSRP